MKGQVIRSKGLEKGGSDIIEVETTTADDIAMCTGQITTMTAGNDFKVDKEGTGAEFTLGGNASTLGTCDIGFEIWWAAQIALLD